MNTHKNARLTFQGRALLIRRINDDGQRPVEAAQAMGISTRTAYKWKRASGSTAHWITIEPVADAIRVMEQLSKAACVAHGVETLWPVLELNRAGKTHVSAEIVNHLNTFREHVNAVLVDDRQTRSIPTTHDGKPFRITTRQFRCTLAWYIANRPFGTIAGDGSVSACLGCCFRGLCGNEPFGFHATG